MNALSRTDEILNDIVSNVQARSFISPKELLSRPLIPAHYLVHKRIPQGKVVMFASEGGLGKTMLMLQLFKAICIGGRENIFGGEATQIGIPCFLLLGEDNANDVNIRLHNMDIDRANLPDFGGIVTVPDCGAMPLVETEYGSDQVVTTEAFAWLESQIKSQQIVHSPRLGFVAIDPVNIFLPIDGNSSTQVQGAISHFAHLAAKYDVTIILVHHVNKGGEVGSKAGIKGSTAWVDGVRAAYMLSELPATEAKMLREASNLPQNPLLRLQLVKSNSDLYNSPVTLLRQDNGVLLDVSALAGEAKVSLTHALWLAIKYENDEGNMLRKTGEQGLYARRKITWPGGLGGLAKNKFTPLINELISTGQVVEDAHKGLLVVEKDE